VTDSRLRRQGAVVVLAALGIIALSTLGSDATQTQLVAETSWSCLVCGDAGATDVLLNLLLFFPLGLGLRLAGWPAWMAVGGMVALTAGVEVAQATVLVGRDATLSDVLANSLGGMAGYAALPPLRRLLAPSVSMARRASVVWLGVAVAVWVATGWGLRPVGSVAVPWVGQPMREWPGHDRFQGRLQKAALNGVEVVNDPLVTRPSFQEGVVLELELTRTDARTPARPVSLLRIVDGNGRPQLGASQRGEALVVGMRTRAGAWRVRTPTWRFDGAMVMPTDTPWRLEWHWLRDRVELRSGPADGSTMEDRALPLSIGLGWAFVHPFAASVSSPHVSGWTILWLALWGVPLGWCLGWLRRKEAAVWVAVAVGSYCAASLYTGLPIRPWELATLLCWLAGGAISATLARQRHK
jgi:hypothetical protein